MRQMHGEVGDYGETSARSGPLLRKKQGMTIEEMRLNKALLKEISLKKRVAASQESGSVIN